MWVEWLDRLVPFCKIQDLPLGFFNLLTFARLRHLNYLSSFLNIFDNPQHPQNHKETFFIHPSDRRLAS